MALFLTLSIPLWYMLIVSFYRTPARGWRGVFLPYLGGLLTGSGSLLITLGLLTRVPFSMNPAALFAWAWLRGPGWPMLGTAGTVIAVMYRRSTSYSRIREISGWLSGAATVFTLWYGLTPDPGFDAYRVFFIPVLFIAATGGAAWLADRGLRLEGAFRIALLAASLVFPALITILPVLYVSGEILASWLLAVFFAAGTTFLALLDSRGRFS